MRLKRGEHGCGEVAKKHWLPAVLSLGGCGRNGRCPPILGSDQPDGLFVRASAVDVSLLAVTAYSRTAPNESRNAEYHSKADPRRTRLASSMPWRCSHWVAAQVKMKSTSTTWPPGRR